MAKLTAAALTLAALFLASCSRGPHRAPPGENVVRIALDQKMTTLDPHLIQDVYSGIAAGLVYDSLYEFHFLKRPLEVVPALAAALPVFSRDHRTLTITLKKGIHFQDDPCFADGKGRELTAADVVYSLERIASAKTMSPGYGDFAGTIKGIEAFHAGKAASIAGLRALDPYTVRIELTRPLPRFVHRFTDIRTSAVVPKECVEKLGEDFRRHPVGTGPYRVTQSNLSSRVVLERNPSYHTMLYPSDGNPGDRERGYLDDAGRALPLADKVILEVVIESHPAWLRFLSGDFELMRIPPDNIADALPGGKLSPKLAALGLKHLQAVRGETIVAFFNMEDLVWGKSKDLRHAFALALDVPKLIHLEWADQAVAAQSMVDPNQYGYDPAYKSKWTTRNVDQARELLAKAGHPGGQGLAPIHFPTLADAFSRRRDEIIGRAETPLGVKIDFEPMTWPEFDRHGRTKNLTMMMIAKLSDEPDIDGSITAVLSSEVAPGENWANYQNPAVDRLVDEIRGLENGPVRLAKIRQLKDKLDDDLPYIPIAHRIGNALYQPWVKNPIYMDDIMLSMWLKYLHVEPTKP